MASVKSRNPRGRKDEEDFRNWRSPHHKSGTDHFRHQGGRRDRPERDHRSDRHDRGQRENGVPDKASNYRTRHRESKPHRWSSDRRSEAASRHGRKLDVYSSTEFPILGAKETNARNKPMDTRLDHSYTPDSIRPSFQRQSSVPSTDWASRIEQFEKDKERALQDMMRYKRRLLMSESSDGSSEDQENLYSKIDMNAKPKKEYETDENVIVRRQKQIDKGKNTLGYDNYLLQVPKYRRVKNTHIFTPNKFQKCSRRAWDGLIKHWRRRLHDYDPEDTYKPERVARKELHFSDTTSETSSEPDVRMDSDLNNSMSSAISDYLASNESSRPETPDQETLPDTPTKELKGLTVSDDVNGNYQTGGSGTPAITSNNNNVVTPDTTLTPSVTPADHEVEGQTVNHVPQVNPSDLIAALRHAAQLAQPPTCVASMNPVTFHPSIYSAPSHMTSNLSSQFMPEMPVRSFPHPHDNVANAKMPKDKKNGDIFDNFNLDDCFLHEEDVIV